MFPRLQNRKNSEMVLDKVKHVSAATYTMNPYDHLVLVSDAENAVTVTLPNVAEAMGHMYVIRTVDASGTNGVDVIADATAQYTTTEVDPSAGTTLDLGSDVAIDTAGDFLCVMSDGMSWIVLAHYIQ